MNAATRKALCGLVLTIGVIGANSLHAADVEFSQAEQQLFLADHLHGIGKSAVLLYDFRKTGTLEKSFQDTVVLSVKSDSAKGRGVEVGFLNGERKVSLPAMEDAKGNPVILYFLERDVREMHMRLGGSENYFRRRIRLAFAEAAEVLPVTVSFEGKDIVASEVTIHPFQNDPMQAKLQKFENKAYAFTLSDQVPGGVYRLRSWLADAGKEAANRDEGSLLLDETLTFQRVRR